MNKKTTKKIIEAVFSFGLILTGIFLLLLAPASFYSANDLKSRFVSKQIIGERVWAQSDEPVCVSYNDIEYPRVPLKKDDQNYNASLTASSAIVIDENTGDVLYEYNTEEVRPLASISKLMSAIVLMELDLDWSSTTTVSEADGNGDHHVESGQTYSLEDLWNIALVGSSNRAINALIRSTGITFENFALLMNKKAAELGLNSLSFEEPTGLSPENVGNVRDTALLLRRALRFEKIYLTLKKPEYRPISPDGTLVWSTNWLLTDWIPNDFEGTVVGKTGYIDQSLYNFTVLIDPDGQDKDIIVAVLGAGSNEKRFEEARDLADWIFSEYDWR